jgi:hypothetical protein
MQKAEQALEQLLADLRAKLPDTPLRLVTGMADGADRVAARVALRAHVPVIALLPMPEPQYLTDFSTESAAEFKALMSDPGVQRIELPLPDDLLGRDADITGAARIGLYRRLGESLARRANLMVVLWDGLNTGRPGGTSEVLLRFLHSMPETDAPQRAVDILHSVPGNAVSLDLAYWIPVRRTDQPPERSLPDRPLYLSGNLGPCRVRAHRTMPAELHTILAEIDGYNRQFSEIAPPADTLAALAAEEPQPPQLRHSLEQAGREFAKADHLAVHNQRYSERVFSAIAWLAVIGGVSFLVYAKLWSWPFFLYAYVICLTTAWLISRLAHRRHWFSRHLMYRVVAETLRTRYFLAVAGISSRVNINHLLHVTGISYFTGFSWISHILRAADAWYDNPASTQQEIRLRLDVARSQWIDSQAKYFNHKITGLQRRYARLEHLKTALLAGIMVIAVSLLLLKQTLTQITLPDGTSLKTLSVFFLGVLPLVFGIWEIYQQKMAVRELLWQYRNQAAYFELAALKLDQARSTDTARNIIEALGQTCLIESFLWAVHRYHREHEPIAAG